jgi:hypothetical protein
MKQGIMKMVSRLLIVSLLMLPFQAIQAGMVATDQVSVTTSAQLDRDTVLSTINRADVAQQLQAMGIDTKAAQARVAAMTDQEARTVASQIDSLPAGAHSNNGWAWAAVVVIAVLIWYYWK